MTKLSVNINKIATIRNSRGGKYPDVRQAAINVQRFGADGVTVHPRPDERHITYKDVYDISPVITTEFNIEGNPREQKFIDLVMNVKPHQVTLVPDAVGQITSNHGWDTVTHKDYLTSITELFHSAGIRVSVFVDPDLKMVKGAAITGADRIELYTEAYARAFDHKNDDVENFETILSNYVAAAEFARQLGMGINAGHDLDRFNLADFCSAIPFLDEVSIGHALISDALYLGLENTVQLYKRNLGQGD